MLELLISLIIQVFSLLLGVFNDPISKDYSKKCRKFTDKGILVSVFFLMDTYIQGDYLERK